MSENDAAREIQRFVRGLKGLSELAPELLELGSIKQAKLEAESRLKSAQEEEKKLTATLSELKEQVAARRAEALEVTKNASLEYTRLIDEAKEKAAAAAKAIKDKAEHVVKIQTAKLNEVNAAIKAAQDRLLLVNGEVAQAKARHDDIQSQLSKIVKGISAGV